MREVLGLMSAQGSFDTEIIAKLLEDSSVIGMLTAVNLAAKYLDIELLMDIIPRLSKHKRLRIAMALLKTGRYDVVERLYTKFGISEQQDMLLYTSEIFFKEHLEQDKLEGFTEKQWRQMAKRFPSITCEQIEKNLKKSIEPSWLTQLAVFVVLDQFHKTAPVLGLSVISQAIICMKSQYLPLVQYSYMFPEQIGDLIRKQPTPISISLPVVVLRKFKNEVLCELAEKNALQNLMIVFPKLHSKQRVVLYESIGESLRNQSGALPLVYVKALPRSVREKEALHAFNLPLLETRPLEKLPYLSVLPFYQALPLATPFLNQPEGELRAAAVSVLVRCARYDSTELDNILDFCLKRENEQDPVRLAMMTALVDLPPTRWLGNHLPKLKLIIAAALKARDCSFQTMDAAARLLLKMIMLQTDFVVAELPVLVERMGRLNVPSLESQISNVDMVRLDSCLLPLMKTWVARDRSQVAISLIYSFGCRIKSVYQLQKSETKWLGLISGQKLGLIKLLIDLTLDKRGYVARMGLEALIRLGISEEVSQLIPQLIQQDPSWIQVNGVSEYLFRHRQSLLTPFLKPRIYNNRFSSGKTAVILNFQKGFLRFTANQQQIYAYALNDILYSDKRNAWELYQCVNRLSAMPSADLSALKNLAKLDARDVALRDKAIEALGKADAGRGVTELIQALDDNRANIAIYALRRSILEMSEKNALFLLSKAPRNKVTVEKEVIRLAGEFDGDDSYRFLSEFAKEKNLHPDVKIAVLRAFWKHLNKEEVWDYFHTAAQSEHAALARSTIRIPQKGLSPIARNHLSVQLALLLKNSNAQIRMETLERLVYMPLGTDDYLANERGSQEGQITITMYDALASMLEDVDVNICKLAAEAMLATYISKKDNKLVETFAKVKRPKSIVAIVDAFEHRNFVNVLELRNCAKFLSLTMLEQRHQPSQALRLTITLLTPSNILEVIEAAENVGLLHPGAVESNLKTWGLAVKTHSQQDLAILESKLRLSESVGKRRLGFGLLIETASQHGWTNERRECLCEYCVDPELWLSEAAGLVEPPQTLENHEMK